VLAFVKVRRPDIEQGNRKVKNDPMIGGVRMLVKLLLSAKSTPALADVLVGEKATLSNHLNPFQNPCLEMSFSHSAPAKRTLQGSDLIGFILLVVEGSTGG
jgi:hypothetical protein